MKQSSRALPLHSSSFFFLAAYELRGLHQRAAPCLQRILTHVQCNNALRTVGNSV
jgi:hypothetical protein